jgi:hypothetical protein
MVEEELAHRIGTFPIGSEVVLHDQAAGLDEIDRVRRLLEAPAVEEEQLERRTLGKVIAPIADEQLDIREATEPFEREGRS